jgi:hypothetical protein
MNTKDLLKKYGKRSGNKTRTHYVTADEYWRIRRYVESQNYLQPDVIVNGNRVLPQSQKPKLPKLRMKKADRIPFIDDKINEARKLLGLKELK